MAVKEDYASGDAVTPALQNAYGDQINENDEIIKSLSTTNLEQELRILLLEQDASLTSPDPAVIQADVFSDADGYADTVNTTNTTMDYDSDEDNYRSLERYDTLFSGSASPWETDSEITTGSGGATDLVHIFTEVASGGITDTEGGYCPGHTQEFVKERVWSMEAGKTFTIDELPLVLNVTTAQTYVWNGYSGAQSSDDSGEYEFEKKDANTVRWRKDGGSWNDVDVTAWTKTTLEFEGVNHADGTTGPPAGYSCDVTAENTFYLTDGTNKSTIWDSSEHYAEGANRTIRATSSTIIDILGRNESLALESTTLNDAGDSVDKEQVAVMFEDTIGTNAGTTGVQVSTDGGSNWTTETTTFIESGAYTHTGWIPVTTQGTDVRIRINTTKGSSIATFITIPKWSVAWYPGG